MERLEIEASKCAQESLHQAKLELESRVQERTAELTKANEILVLEIAERTRIEEELRRTEERFRLLVETVRDYAIFMMDTDGHVTSWNSGAEQIKGFQADEIIGQHFSRFYPPEDLERANPKAQLSVAAAEGRCEDEGWRMRKDGSRFWANVVITAVRDSSGELIGFSKITRDLTERKRAEEERQKLVSLVENSHDFIGIASPEGRAQFVNPSGQALVGLNGNEQVRSTTIFDYVVEDDQTKFRQEALPAVIRDGHWEGEVRFRHFHTGAAIPMLQHIFFIKEPGSGRRLALATISRDITERKLAEETLQATKAEMAHMARLTAMGELTASIAHEINQPLSAIVNNANACRRLLTEDSPNLKEVREAIDDIQEAGTRAGDVISHIRNLVKKAVPEKNEVDVNQLIHEVLALVLSDLEKHHVLLQLELAAGLSPVVGDRVQLQQVMLNLIMNGIEAMSGVADRLRTLLVRSQAHAPGCVLVTVQDAGAGLDPRHAGDIFEPFFTTKPNGLGMGLSISRSIIEAHGGKLWAKPAEDKGATFQFTLPACA
ncbi:MAG: PAS domain-containing sensor histidine kinase [Isosphaeraceae bacterium]